MWTTVRNMQTGRVVIDDALLRAADRAARTLKLNRSALIRQALHRHLEQVETLERERRDRDGYRGRPTPEDEFAVWDRVAVWPED